MPEEIRSVYAYELHGHDADGPLDYGQFFASLAQLTSRQRQFQLVRSNEVVAIPEVRAVGDVYELRFLIGREGEMARFYDLQSGTEREAAPQRGEVAVQGSWLVIDTAARLVVQERRRPGVPLQLAIRGLTGIGRERGIATNLTISLGPIADRGFIEELDGLDRIKSAAVIMQRPNMSWTNTADSILSDYAEDSNVGTVEFGATARPKDSLSKNSGIIADIKAMVSTAFGPLTNVRIVGRQDGESKDRTVSLKQHARRREIQIPQAASPAEEQEVLLSGALSYLNDLVEERGYPEERPVPRRPQSQPRARKGGQ